MSITINGKKYKGGRNVSIVNDKVYINGQLQFDNKDNKEKIEIHIEKDAILKNLEIDGDNDVVIHGDVNGDVNIGGSLSCDNINGNAMSGGSLKCDDIKGNVNAGGSLKCDTIGGNVNAGGSIKCKSIKGDINK